MSSTDGYAAAGELLRALAAPLRVAIVTELGTGARCVHELVDTLRVPQPLVSQHLRVLRDAGVVRPSRRGREIEYSLTDKDIAGLVADAVTRARELASQSSEETAGTGGNGDDARREPEAGGSQSDPQSDPNGGAAGSP